MTFEEPLEDQGEIGDMKKQYASQLSMIKDVFPDWSDIDLLFALTESDGDIEVTIERIATGMSRQVDDTNTSSARWPSQCCLSCLALP